jgi:hypothetical protein
LSKYQSISAWSHLPSMMPRSLETGIDLLYPHSLSCLTLRAQFNIGLH